MNKDIVIVGSGPAGLTISNILLSFGKSVTLIDKLPKRNIGRKCSAGGLTTKAYKYIPDKLIHREFNEMSFYINDNKYTIHSNSNIPIVKTIDRHELGQYMLSLINNDRLSFT